MYERKRHACSFGDEGSETVAVAQASLPVPPTLLNILLRGWPTLLKNKILPRGWSTIENCHMDEKACHFL